MFAVQQKKKKEKEMDGEQDHFWKHMFEIIMFNEVKIII